MPKRGPGRSSMILCNHFGFMEILTEVISPLSPSFTPKAIVETFPIVSGLAVALQSMFIERGGTVEERNKIV